MGQLITVEVVLLVIAEVQAEAVPQRVVLEQEDKEIMEVLVQMLVQLTLEVEEEVRQQQEEMVPAVLFLTRSEEVEEMVLPAAFLVLLLPMQAAAVQVLTQVVLVVQVAAVQVAIMLLVQVEPRTLAAAEEVRGTVPTVV